MDACVGVGPWSLALIGALAGCASANDRLSPDDPRFLSEATDHYSGHRAEVVIRHFFRDAPELAFVDIGCGDYRRASVTYYLDHVLRWRGVGLDPNTELGLDYREHRRHTTFLSLSVTDKLDERGLAYPEGSDGDAELTAYEEGKPSTYTVTLDLLVPRLVRDLPVGPSGPRFDFLSIGVSRGALDILHGFDQKIDQVAPRLIRVLKDAPDRDDQVAAFLALHGYMRVREYETTDVYDLFFMKQPS